MDVEDAPASVTNVDGHSSIRGNNNDYLRMIDNNSDSSGTLDQLSTTPQAKRVVHDDELSQHTFSAMYGREPQDRAQANPPEHQADASLGGVGPA